MNTLKTLVKISNYLSNITCQDQCYESGLNFAIITINKEIQRICMEKEYYEKIKDVVENANIELEQYDIISKDTTTKMLLLLKDILAKFK